MKNIKISKINSFVVGVIATIVAVVFVFNIPIANAQFSDYTSYAPASSFSDYTSYAPSYSFSDYTSYSPASSFSDYTSYAPATSFSDYTSYAPASSFSDYTSYAPESSFSDYTSYAPATSFSDYTSYAPASSFSDYTSYAPVTSFSDYTSYEPVSYSSSGSYYYPSTTYSTGASYSVGSSYYPSSYYSTGGYYGGSTYYGGNTSYHYDNPRPQVESLSASCSVNDSNPETGDQVTWTVDNVSGGNGNYSYSWSGDNNLSGSGRTVSKSYSTSGTKNARVTITSGSQTISRNCSTYVERDYNPPVYRDNLDASCTVDQATAYVGERVNWSAQDVEGGNGRYSYSWSGTNGLSGDDYSVRKTYNTPGTKYAYLSVRSNGQTISRTCSIYVNERYSGYVAPIVTGNGVLLSQVPYTGAISNMKIVLFTLALMLWSAIVTYIVILRKRSKLALATVAVNGDEAEQSAIKESLMSHDNMLSDLETFARSKNVIVSDKALSEIARLAGNDRKNAETLLTSLANRHSNGEGWTTLDLEKVQSAVK